MISREGEGSWGRSNRLVCTACNRPINGAAEPAWSRRRLASLVTLLALVLTGAVVFTLSTLHDLRSPPPEPAQAEPAPEG
jgi:hypothetical protein